MIRGKIFHKENKRVYSVLSIDYFNSKVDVLDGDVNRTFDFKEVIFFESTGIKSNKGFIYRGDLIIAKDKKTGNKYLGIVVKNFAGMYFIKNKKENIFEELLELKLNGYNFKNCGNAIVYFEKIKSSKNK